MLKLYNTLTRKKEVFKPIKKGNVGMYNCGPTVYWYQHIGNLKAYIFADLLRRVLEFNKYKVKQVINVTDVGHLTSDADEGEDKIEKAAKREGKTAREIADYYFKLFLEDLKKLEIKNPDVWSKATEHIKEQINLIKKLEEKGYTYRTSDGIYFDTSKLDDYGKLAKLKKEGLKAGARVSIGEKKNKTDFALWKFSSEPGKRQQEWQSPWGLGFPGWHIECSAMSMKYLGEYFDIHTGGVDHIPVHHTNEIAQSEAATGKKFVNYWMHEEFLTFKGEKVSKSKGGLYTISELEKSGYSALAYRYFILSGSYRKQIDFSLEILKNAQNSLERLRNIIQEFEDDKKENSSYLKEFEKAINDDLNTPLALQVLWKLIRDKKAEGKIGTIRKMDSVLGLRLLEKEKIEIPEEIEKLAEEREKARKKSNWKLADELREKIKKKKWQIDDSDSGYKIRKI
ncbi:cysteine--tRNA ligase [Candidatus Pacearchaeota archaeon]|nr:cysteine--tRNA ligase [Candidatus Pacearchaeota archaeon]